MKKIFTKEEIALKEEMKSVMNRPEENRRLIYDGVFDLKSYLAQDIRIAWMLKEPYDEDDGSGGGWDYFDMFPKGGDLYDMQFKNGHKSTWHPMIYVSYGILKGFLKWSDMNYLRDQKDMCNVVFETAFINLQKLPSKNSTSTIVKDLEIAAIENQDLILKQLDLIDPNILVFGNTFQHYSKLLKIDFSLLRTYKRLKYAVVNKKLYIATYHPSQRTLSRQEYIDQIIELVEEWKLNKLE